MRHHHRHCPGYLDTTHPHWFSGCLALFDVVSSDRSIVQSIALSFVHRFASCD
ncbi:uncharacterized protein BDV14DRAFT_180041 [Aspergillus stella-maris]|uniref:uncharacterized protein n=1 Tax=Aspergillus stella-maris TaxID=1810926 RepID=UPI003CCDE0FF